MLNRSFVGQALVRTVSHRFFIVYLFFLLYLLLSHAASDAKITVFLVAFYYKTAYGLFIVPLFLYFYTVGYEDIHHPFVRARLSRNVRRKMGLQFALSLSVLYSSLLLVWLVIIRLGTNIAFHAQQRWIVAVVLICTLHLYVLQRAYSWLRNRVTNYLTAYFTIVLFQFLWTGVYAVTVYQPLTRSYDWDRYIVSLGEVVTQWVVIVPLLVVSWWRSR